MNLRVGLSGYGNWTRMAYVPARPLTQGDNSMSQIITTTLTLCHGGEVLAFTTYFVITTRRSSGI